MKNIKNLSDFKKLKEGTILTLVEAVRMPGHPYLNVPRKIEKKQTDAIRFEGGSWLLYPTAKEFRMEKDDIAVIQETDREGQTSDILFYKIEEEDEHMSEMYNFTLDVKDQITFLNGLMKTNDVTVNQMLLKALIVAVMVSTFFTILNIIY